MKRARVLLAEPLNADAEQRLAARAELVRPADAGAAALCAAVAGCEALIARTSTRVDDDLLAAGAALRVVGVAGVGTDNVDVVAAQRRGIAVLNMAAAASDAVAEFTFALLLQLLRPIPRLADGLRRGEYAQTRAKPHGVELRELTVGIVGMGRIGSRVGRICAAGVGARVRFCDIVEIAPLGFAAERVALDELLATSDVVSLHVPLTEQTRGMIGAAALARMRSGSFLVNTARGAVVNTPALVEALRSAHLAGAALDVTEPEPLPPDHPLLGIPQCIVTPHVAARTKRGMERMFEIVEAVLEFLDRR